MLDQGDRDHKIAEIGWLIMESPDNRRDTLTELKKLREDLGVSPNNVAGHLIRYLQSQPLSIRPEKPWVASFIKELMDQGARTHTSGTAPAWLPSDVTV